MWVYIQKTGELRYNVEKVGVGYSGHGPGKNNPSFEQTPNVGPLPQGVYKIGKAFKHPSKGPIVMRLFPDHDNEMYDRGGFLIHGDSIKEPGTASNGCIILSQNLREMINSSPDKQLQVINL